MIQFLLNDELVSIENERADLTLLNYLRDQRALIGTKEGCASGDCGACTVVVAQPSTQAEKEEQANNALNYQAINSCVTFLSALQGKQVITVEHLGSNSQLHPVQQAMVDENASQCGFCTPGFVMSIFAMYQRNSDIDRSDVITALSGNLCRCTGYQSIINAALNACNSKTRDEKQSEEQNVAKTLKHLNTQSDWQTENLCLPTTREALAKYIQTFPNALLVAGSTDLALLHTQQLNPIEKLISLTHIPDLKEIEVLNNSLKIGAACTLSEMQSALFTHFPSLHEIIDRFASVPIRNQATVGGNIANASPIGDLAPVFIALDANVTLDDGKQTRSVALKDFFTGYRQTIMGKHEWLDSIEIPLLTSQQHLRAYKISKRIEDDISAVCMAVKITLEDNVVIGLSAGFGGVAATPATNDELTNKLVGQIWQDKQCIAIGQEILKSAFTPLDDVRASAEYRVQMLQNLWKRYWLETNSHQHAIATRVTHHA